MRKWLRHLRHLWWVPALTLTLSLTAALAYVLHCAPTYVSQASLWETERIHLPETVWLAEDPQSRLAAANGQFLLVEREAYRRLGGHAAVADKVLGDLHAKAEAKHMTLANELPVLPVQADANRPLCLPGLD